MINNIYPESVEESGNYLRLTLQNISKYKLAYNPISYLVWYEYATGRNDQLVQDIQLSAETQDSITADRVIKLFKKHLAENHILLAEKKTIELQKILTEVTKHIGKSGGDIDVQNNMLKKNIDKLNKTASLKTITQITNNIIKETKIISQSSSDLTNRLDSAVSEIKILKEKLAGIEQDAKMDMLTNLLNRRGFEEAVDQVLKDTKTTNEPVSLVMLDIDHFKKVNDTYGHLVGDNVLKILGKLLRNCIKGKDIAARFGGEEFILVLPQTSIKGAYTLAEEIRSALQKMKLKIKNSSKSMGQITISLGIALFKENESVDAVIKRADDALYRAKNTGRNKTITELNFA